MISALSPAIVALDFAPWAIEHGVGASI